MSSRIGLTLSCMCLAALAAAPAGEAELVRFPPTWTSPYKVDPQSPHHFVNAEGKHLFVMNKTAWAFFGCKDPKGYLERAKAQGVNVIRAALEGKPYFKELGVELWPWGGTREKPDFSSFNETYWKEVERRTRLAGEAGIGLDVVLYFEFRPTKDAIETQRRYWQHAIERLGNCANVFIWEIENEYLGDPELQDAAGTFFHEHDPYGRPVCTSDGTTNDAAWPKKPWVDVAINHSCTGSKSGGENEKRKHTLDGWYLASARNARSHGKPAFCNESGRENRHRNNDGVHRRKQAWLWCASGAYWTWHSWDGCEGIEDASYKAPGAEFIEPLTRFFRSIPFYDLEPADALVAVSPKKLIHATLASKDGSLIVSYLCVEESGGRVEGASLRLAPSLKGSYAVKLMDPRNLKVSATCSVAPGGQAELPAFSDDMLAVMERK